MITAYLVRTTDRFTSLDVLSFMLVRPTTTGASPGLYTSLTFLLDRLIYVLKNTGSSFPLHFKGKSLTATEGVECIASCSSVHTI